MALRLAIGAIAGAAFGYIVMYRLIGCSTGVCPITKNPFMSTIYGAIIGGLIASGI
ncbi:MAG: YtxH domain-containing protein [Proteobacteria bacterium]|nr:YtxH domain-containing protein [Pseudomonadota bacterium]